MIRYRKKFVNICEAWQTEEPEVAGVDLVRRFQQSAPVPAMFCREFYTILLDLSQEPDVLLHRLKKDNRYEIRRAARENFQYYCRNAQEPQVFAEFCGAYEQFAAQKQQPPLNCVWLQMMAETGALCISRVAEQTGAPLVWHVYYRSGGRTTLLYSVSLFRSSASSTQRNRIGRANRYHHWQDIMRFKAEGETVYDFGGWYQGHEDGARLRINKFKEEFGGEIIKNYICERGLTLKGQVFLRLRQKFLGNAI